MSAVFRVRPYSEVDRCVVRHPVHGDYVAPDPAAEHAADDPLVMAFPHLFVADEVDAPVIEQATRAPGERRTTRRPKR